jgi:hypothetical protein
VDDDVAHEVDVPVARINLDDGRVLARWPVARSGAKNRCASSRAPGQHRAPRLRAADQLQRGLVGVLPYA